MSPKGKVIHMRSARDTVVNPSGLAQLGFLQVSSEMLREMINGDLRYLAEMKQELVLLEPASLYMKQHKGRYSFSCRPLGSRRQLGITSDPQRILDLARREFLHQRIRGTEDRVRELQKAIDRTEDARERQTFQAKLCRFADAGIDLASVIFTREQNEWIDQPYSPNPFYLEDLKNPTAGGLMMRSKSEAGLGSHLESIGLPYRYDDLVTIHYDPLGDRPFRDSYFADIKVPNLSSGITVHEHLGAFQTAHYGESALQRLNDYHKFEIVELNRRPVRHEEITWSFEHDLQSRQLLQRLVRRMLLPGVYY